MTEALKKQKNQYQNDDWGFPAGNITSMEDVVEL